MQEIPEHLYPFDGNCSTSTGFGSTISTRARARRWSRCTATRPGRSTTANLVLALRRDHRVVVPDHIGCGLSDKPGDDRYDYTLGARIDDFGRLMDELGFEDINLVVHDWGGMIGLGWAVRHPERVKRLVILNTAAFHLPKSKPFPWQLWMVRDTPLGPLMVRGFNAFSRGASRVACTRKKLSSEIRDAYCAPYDSWADRIATLRFVQDIPLKPGDRGYDIVSDTAARLDVFRDRPVLICWGDKDFVFDHHFLAEWQRIYPDAEVHRFPDCGHYILEDAAEEIIPLIRTFLDVAP